MRLWAVQTNYPMKAFGALWHKKYHKRSRWASGNLYEIGIEKTFHFYNDDIYFLELLNTYRVFWQEEIMQPSGKHDPPPHLLKNIAGIKLRMNISIHLSSILANSSVSWGSAGAQLISGEKPLYVVIPCLTTYAPCLRRSCMSYYFVPLIDCTY